MTAAINDASTPLSFACWRMMSSWRRGSVNSWMTWLNTPVTPSTIATNATTPAPATSDRRRRRLALLFIR
jgi:hypothetical protein